MLPQLFMKCKECNNEITRGTLEHPASYCSKKCRTRYGSQLRHQRFIEWLAAEKSKPCMDCHQRYPRCCMEFDHRPGENKAFELGHARGMSQKRKVEEMAKCDLVCANCHRIRTESRKGNS